eukprot:55136_1
MCIKTLLITILFIVKYCNCDPAFALTFTDFINNETWFNITKQQKFKAVAVYAGDIETYCRGCQQSTKQTKCYFNGPFINSYIYYLPLARKAAARFAVAGIDVYLTFDGLVGEGNNEYVANFGSMTSEEINAFANKTASIVCNDRNVKGLLWNVQPLASDQLFYFTILSTIIENCHKKWFLISSSIPSDLWSISFGSAGSILFPTYEYGYTRCQCSDPTHYKQWLIQQLNSLITNCEYYHVDFAVLLTATGTATIYTEYTGSNISCDGNGIVHNITCSNNMSVWIDSALTAMEYVSVKNNSHFKGVGVFGYNDRSVFQPTIPPTSVINLINEYGYFEYNNTNILSETTTTEYNITTSSTMYVDNNQSLRIVFYWVSGIMILIFILIILSG